MSNDKYVSIELIDKMEDTKKSLKTVSRDNIETILKSMSEDEKDVLLRLYIYESNDSSIEIGDRGNITHTKFVNQVENRR